MLKYLPSITSTVDKTTLRTILDEYATQNNFVLTISKSDAMSLTFQCKKSDIFKITLRQSCPYKIRFSAKFKLLPPVNENERFPRGLFIKSIQDLWLLALPPEDQTVRTWKHLYMFKVRRKETALWAVFPNVNHQRIFWFVWAKFLWAIWLERNEHKFGSSPWSASRLHSRYHEILSRELALAVPPSIRVPESDKPLWMEILIRLDLRSPETQ
ncbi:unnamed protein product [Rhizopus stolonifer]